MTPQATVEGLPPHFAAHIDLLQGFLKGRRVSFGSPEDLTSFTSALSGAGTFPDEMAAMLRTVVYREGMAIRRSDLFAILLFAVCGPVLPADDSLREPVAAAQYFVQTLTEPMQLLPEQEPVAAPEPVPAELPVEEPAPSLASTREYPILPTFSAAPNSSASTVPDVDQPPALEPELEPVAPVESVVAAEEAPAFTYHAESAAEAFAAPDPHLAAEFPDAHQPRLEPLEAYVPPSPPPAAAPPVQRASMPAAAPSRRRTGMDWIPALLVFCALAVALCVGLYVHHRSALRSAAAERASLEAARREAPPPQPYYGPGPVAVPAVPAATPEAPAAAPEALEPSPAIPAASETVPRDDGGPDRRADERETRASRRERARERAMERRNESRTTRTSGGTAENASASDTEGSFTRVPTAAKSAPPPVPASTATSPAPALTAKAVIPPADPTSADDELQATAKGFFSVSSGIMSDHLLSAPLPSYPKLATVTHVEGEVIVQAVVGRDGSVVATRVLRGPRLLRGAAQHAVQGWKYRPYFVNGKPTEVATIATVSFRLDDKAPTRP